MEDFKNVKAIRAFCKEKGISFTSKDKKDDLLDKVEKWEDGITESAQAELKENRETKTKAFTAYEFGNLYKLDKVSIKYLRKVFGEKKDSYEGWIQECKDKKVID